MVAGEELEYIFHCLKNSSNFWVKLTSKEKKKFFFPCLSGQRQITNGMKQTSEIFV